MRMRTAYSAISSLAYELRAGYRDVLSLAAQAEDSSLTMQNEVDEEESKLSSQLAKVGQVISEAESKMGVNEQKANEAYARMEQHQATLDYLLANPRTETHQDENGNSYTVVIYDDAGIAAARRGIAEESQNYQYYSGLCQEARQVRDKASSLKSNLDTLKGAVSMVRQNIENNVYEMRKYQSSCSDEAEYNMQSIVAVMDAVGAYVVSKTFKLTTGFSPSAARTYTGGSARFEGKTSASAPNSTENSIKAAFVAKKSGDGAKSETTEPAGGKKAKKFPFKYCEQRFCKNCTELDRAYVLSYADAIYTRRIKGSANVKAATGTVIASLDKVCEELFPTRQKPNARMLCAIRVRLIEVVEDGEKTTFSYDERMRLL